MRIIRKGEKSYLELPADFNNYEEIELFRLKDGFYLLSLLLGQKTESMGEQEKNLLRKMLSVKFEKRTVPQMEKMLLEQEIELLKKLMRMKVITVFKSAKYPNGVYNISDNAYAMLQKTDVKKSEKKPEEKKAPITPVKTDAYSALMRNGYMVIENNNAAYEFSQELRKAGKANEVIGIKGFDGKFYAASGRYYSKLAGAITKIMKDEPMDVEAIALKCNEDKEGCRTVLKIMADKGDAIEKKKDIFVLV